MRIAVVGPCASGKTVLEHRLRELGYQVTSCAQEHSYVPEMWQRISRPDLLIYLEATLSSIAERRVIDWGEEHLAEQRHRLRHAREHCDLYLQTDGLTEEEVFERVRRFLEKVTKPEGEG